MESSNLIGQDFAFIYFSPLWGWACSDLRTAATTDFLCSVWRRGWIYRRLGPRVPFSSFLSLVPHSSYSETVLIAFLIDFHSFMKLYSLCPCVSYLRCYTIALCLFYFFSYSASSTFFSYFTSKDCCLDTRPILWASDLPRFSSEVRVCGWFEVSDWSSS